MINVLDYVPILPAALLVATAICLPLHLMQAAATGQRERRDKERSAPARVPRGVTVPYVSRRDR